MSYALLIFLLAAPQVTTGNFIFTQALPAKMVKVSVKIDFGPAGKPLIEKEITVPEGATPKEALRKICPVEAGAACCHPAEVKGIDGVSIDPLNNRWWRLKINGAAKNASPHKTRLRAGDLVEWIYFEDKQ